VYFSSDPAAFPLTEKFRGILDLSIDIRPHAVQN
jgi:hypothetical protein